MMTAEPTHQWAFKFLRNTAIGRHINAVMGAWKVAVHDNTRLYRPWEKADFVLASGDVFDMKTRKIEK